MEKRNECLNVAKVSEMLGLDRSVIEKRSIASDLELRAKNRTIAKLKRQGEQYKTFNREIHYLMEPQAHKEQLVAQLRQRLTTTNARVPSGGEATKSLDAETSSKVGMINRGLNFQRAQEQISSGVYFLKKYDLDY